MAENTHGSTGKNWTDNPWDTPAPEMADEHIGDRTDSTAVMSEPSQPKLNLQGVDFFRGCFDRPEQEKEEAAILEGLKYLCNRSDNDSGFAFVVEGCSGIGKTTLVSNVLCKNAAFIQNECNVHVVLWLNCYEWPNGITEQKAKQSFLEKLLEIGGQTEQAEECFETLKQMEDHFSRKGPTPLRILFVLDDVFHFSILQVLREECPNALCCAITHDAANLQAQNFNSLLKCNGLVNPMRVPRLSDDSVLKILPAPHWEDNLTVEQLKESARHCSGLPMLVNLVYACYEANDSLGYQERYGEFIDLLRRAAASGETASQLAEYIIGKLSQRIRYYAFLLFNPGEKVSLNSLSVLWDCKHIHQIEHTIDMLTVSRLIKTVSPAQEYIEEERARQKNMFRDLPCGSSTRQYYLVHPTLHASAVKMALKQYQLEQAEDPSLMLSRLRVRVLNQLGAPKIPSQSSPASPASNILTCLDRVDGQLNATILSHIDNAAFELLDNSQKPDYTVQQIDHFVTNAAQFGHSHLLKYLIEKNGVDLSASKKELGVAALALASSSGHENVVELLIGNRVDVHAVDENGRTFLMHAASNGRDKVVRLLIDNKVNVNAVDKDGWTALMRASARGRTLGVQLLLDANADLDVADKNGRTALAIAAERGHDEIVKLLSGGKGNVAANVEANDQGGCRAFLHCTKFWRALSPRS